MNVASYRWMYDTEFKRVVLGVVLAHFVVFCWMAYTPRLSEIARPVRRLAVKTVSLQAKPREAVVAAPKPLKKKAAPKKKVVEPKKEVVKPKKEVVKPKREATKPKKNVEQVKKKQALLSKVQSSMAKLKNVDMSTLKPITIDAMPFEGAPELSSQEIGYRDELASRLRMLLRLPEDGAVKVKLTLKRSGSVADLAIVSTESRTNKKYVEETLPTLSFPSFGKHFGNLAEYTFLITLTS